MHFSGKVLTMIYPDPDYEDWLQLWWITKLQENLNIDEDETIKESKIVKYVWYHEELGNLKHYLEQKEYDYIRDAASNLKFTIECLRYEMVMKCESFLIKRLFPKNFILDNISAKVIKGFVQTFDSIIYVPRHQDPYYTGNHHYIVPYLEHHYKFNKTKDFLELKEARDYLWNIALMMGLCAPKSLDEKFSEYKLKKSLLKTHYKDSWLINIEDIFGGHEENKFYAINREPLIKYFETMNKRCNGTTEKENS